MYSNVRDGLSVSPGFVGTIPSDPLNLLEARLLIVAFCFVFVLMMTICSRLLRWNRALLRPSALTLVAGCTIFHFGILSSVTIEGTFI